MVDDQQVAAVVRAIHLLDERVRGATKTEIGFLAPMSGVELEHALCRAQVNGWIQRSVVPSTPDRAGVRSGDWVYQLTELGFDRSPTAQPIAIKPAAPAVDVAPPAPVAQQRWAV